MKVALVHDWLLHMRGGEKVLEAIAEIFPDAEIYTLICDRKKLSSLFQSRKIHTSFLQAIPGIKKFYRWLLPALPQVIRTLKIPPVDLVISSSHCVAKGIPIPEGALHLCYCHTPMRYAWGFGNEYFGKMPFWFKPALNQILKRLQKWDVESSRFVDQFVSNSHNVKERIRKFYGREADVIYPPIDTTFFDFNGQERGDYYLAVSAFVPYKRLDLVIDAFQDLEAKLLIVGSGPLESAYRKRRKSPNISFLGGVSSRELQKLYSNAKALIFPTEEDFGMVPVEAQACGTPVIALGKGGALEGVHSGVFFAKQTAEDIQQAIVEFEGRTFDRREVRKQVLDFDRGRFKEKFRQLADAIWEKKSNHAVL